ncbi:hypothetical protein RRG08_000211 [Elysia crispata]|uniref:Uncharacterized protein n=1 Tax=Elysia crispata TaxID=231223 RepID=A0AAE0YV05_9GAST|nr:hypothetical protein RRG08_000211 [Elysia crispata]
MKLEVQVVLQSITPLLQSISISQLPQFVSFQTALLLNHFFALQHCKRSHSQGSLNHVEGREINSCSLRAREKKEGPKKFENLSLEKRQSPLLRAVCRPHVALGTGLISSAKLRDFNDFDETILDSTLSLDVIQYF